MRKAVNEGDVAGATKILQEHKGYEDYTVDSSTPWTNPLQWKGFRTTDPTTGEKHWNLPIGIRDKI